MGCRNGLMCDSGPFNLQYSALLRSLIHWCIDSTLLIFLAHSFFYLLMIQLQQCVLRVQFLESSTVGRSIVSKQEARVCDLENKLEFQRGQVKRFEVRAHNCLIVSITRIFYYYLLLWGFWPQVLVLRLRDSVVRLGEELEQSAQAEARERENARYYQQRLQDMRVEMEELSQREQESGRRRMELVRRGFSLSISSYYWYMLHIWR